MTSKAVNGKFETSGQREDLDGGRRVFPLWRVSRGLGILCNLSDCMYTLWLVSRIGAFRGIDCPPAMIDISVSIINLGWGAAVWKSISANVLYFGR